MNDKWLRSLVIQIFTWEEQNKETTKFIFDLTNCPRLEIKINEWCFVKFYETCIIWMILSFKQTGHFIWLGQISFERWKHNLNQYRIITIIIMIYKKFQFHHFIWASKKSKINLNIVFTGRQSWVVIWHESKEKLCVSSQISSNSAYVWTRPNMKTILELISM